MPSNKQALIPYLLLVAALAGGLLWHESEMVPGLGRTVITGRAIVGGPFRLTSQDGKTVSAKLVIAEDGTTTHAANDGSTLPDQGVVDCVVAELGKITYPHGGGILTVVYPVQFAP